MNWGLEGARKRGAWDGTKAIIDKGRDWVITKMKASGLRGRGGGGFSTGLKWSFMPKESTDGRRAISGQCRRGPSPAPAKDREIMRTIRICWSRAVWLRASRWGAHACYIYVRGGIHPRARAPAGRDRPGLRSKLVGKDNLNGLAVRHLCRARRRRLYLRRKRQHCWESLEGKKGQPRPEAAVPANVGL